MRTFSGNFTNKDLRDDPNDKPFRRGISALQQKSRNDAQQQVADLQKQFQDTGNRPDRAQLNQLEQLGANTFGTGMRGRFDYTGSAEQPISRSQVGQFRNTFNDPSLQVFDRKTGVNPIGLGIGDYANYYQGREDRLAKTPLGGIMNTISDFGDKAMQYSPLNYLIPQSFRGTPPNRQIPSALQEELEGTKLPSNVSFTPPSGLASIKIPSLSDLFSSLNFGAEKNKNQQDLTMDQMITAKGMKDGGYGKGSREEYFKDAGDFEKLRFALESMPILEEYFDKRSKFTDISDTMGGEFNEKGDLINIMFRDATGKEMSEDEFKRRQQKDSQQFESDIDDIVYRFSNRPDRRTVKRSFGVTKNLLLEKLKDLVGMRD